MHPECSWILTTDDSPDDAWCCSVIDTFCMRVKRGLEENPDAFKPAMHQNLQAYAASESGLLKTLPTKKVLLKVSASMKVLVKVWHTFGVHFMVLVLPIVYS